ncbi:MAG: HD domain-containing protein [Thermoplasmata archaeon]|nr:HD domain-containing protein [Thermoplasmata archaeon]
MGEFKTVHDSVHHSIKIGGVRKELLELPELQRLASIKQLGLAYLVFPGANHTRLEHSIGTSYVAERIAAALGLPEEEIKLVSVAAMLHDVGHGPFSHTLEGVLYRSKGVEHMDITKGIITGEYDVIDGEKRRMLEDERRVPDVLEKYGLSPERVAGLVKETRHVFNWELMSYAAEKTKYLNQIIHGPFDADQVDYLLRDAYYTGVAHGTIDFDRLLNTVALENGEVCFHRKGIAAIEGMLVARALMYSSVYFHKTVRIAETMLARAVEGIGEIEENIQNFVDAELMEYLMRKAERTRKTMVAIRYRKIFKKVYARNARELGDEEREALYEISKDWHRRKEAEERIARMSKVDSGNVIIDIPIPELLLSEPRIDKTEVRVLTDSGATMLSKLSPLAEALRIRNVVDWVVMVSCHPKYRQDVERVVERGLFG